MERPSVGQEGIHIVSETSYKEEINKSSYERKNPNKPIFGMRRWGF